MPHLRTHRNEFKRRSQTQNGRDIDPAAMSLPSRKRSFSGAQVRQVAAKDKSIGLVAMPESLNGETPSRLTRCNGLKCRRLA